MEVNFFIGDNYATLKRKFNSVWTNLHLEMHHSGHKLWKEGWDEFDEGANFARADSPNELVFTLTGETTVRAAARLFVENFGGEVFILRDGVSVEDKESLGYCNNPFRLPLNEFTCGEFKRRFTYRWTNLSIKLYNVAPRAGGLWRGEKEFADDFEMKNLRHADRAFLHDYTYPSTWGALLAYVRIAAAIRNETLGVECEGKLKNVSLKEFNAAASAEILRIMSPG